VADDFSGFYFFIGSSPNAEISHYIDNLARSLGASDISQLSDGQKMVLMMNLFLIDMTKFLVYSLMSARTATPDFSLFDLGFGWYEIEI
jgi:hypothetical protein